MNIHHRVRRPMFLLLILVNLMAVSARGGSQTIGASGDDSLPVTGVTPVQFRGRSFSA